MPQNTLQDEQERYYFWSLHALGREIAHARCMPEHKIGKPGSPYSVFLIKCASILKGAGRQIDLVQAWANIQDATSHLHIPQNEQRRMWQRAMKNARPRFPQEN